MRGGRLFAHDAKGVMPRMSWSPHNLYNLINRSMPFYAGQASFKKTAMTMYQQRWKSKRFLRGYHGDWIREKQFTRWYLPTDLPSLSSRFRPNSSTTEVSSEERMPISSLLFRDVERRLDTVVFRCCFARSAREAKGMVVQGKVQVNGVTTTVSGTLLNPGDLISVQPESIPMLGKELARQAEMRAAAAIAGQAGGQSQDGNEGASEASVQAESSQEGQEPATSEAAPAEVDEQPAATHSTTEATTEASTEATTEISSEQGEQIAAKESACEATSTESIEGAADVNPSESQKDDASTEAAEEEGSNQNKSKTKVVLGPGVYPFNLPPYAAPFVFVPPYLEVSFTTCSAIYMRHPTITPVKAPGNNRSNNKSLSVLYKTDTPSPYPAGGELYSLAWEHYTKTAPRTRSDLRRLKLEAQTGTEGIKTARAKDAWKKVRAVRRGYDKVSPTTTPFTVGILGNERKPKTNRSGRYLVKTQSRGKNVTSTSHARA